MVHKERVEFLAKQYLSYRGLSGKYNSVLKIVMQGLKEVSINKLIRRVGDDLPQIL